MTTARWRNELTVKTTARWLSCALFLFLPVFMSCTHDFRAFSLLCVYFPSVGPMRTILRQNRMILQKLQSRKQQTEQQDQQEVTFVTTTSLGLPLRTKEAFRIFNDSLKDPECQKKYVRVCSYIIAYMYHFSNLLCSAGAGC